MNEVIRGSKVVKNALAIGNEVIRGKRMNEVIRGSKVVKNTLAIGNEVKIRGKGMNEVIRGSKVVKNALAIGNEVKIRGKGMKFSKVVKNALAIGNEVKIRGKGMKFSKVVKNALAIGMAMFLASCDSTPVNNITVQSATNTTTVATVERNFYLDSNGVTVKCENALAGDSGNINNKNLYQTQCIRN